MIEPQRRQPRQVHDGAPALKLDTSSWNSSGTGPGSGADPGTGLPARSGLLSSTVIAAEGWQAEAVAKAVFIAGLTEGLFLLASTGTEGLLIDDRGFAYPSAGLDRFTGRQWIDEAADAALAAHGSVR